MPTRVNGQLSYITSDPPYFQLCSLQGGDSQSLPSLHLSSLRQFCQVTDQGEQGLVPQWGTSAEKVSHQQEHAQEQNLNSAGFRAALSPGTEHLCIISTITILSSFLTREHGCHHFNCIRSSTLTDLHTQSPWASISSYLSVVALKHPAALILGYRYLSSHLFAWSCEHDTYSFQ